MLGIELIEGEYDFQSWIESVRGFEREPEKGKRCSICFDRRFEVSAKKAQEIGEKSFTSTLLTSPKKSIQQLKEVGDALAKKYNIEFIAPDYRKKSGTQEQNILAKKDKLYRQDYCGCMFGLSIQREQQKKLPTELFSPISKQIQPQSIEDKIRLYEKRLEFERAGIDYKIIKERFLNWRVEFGYLKAKKEVTPAHFLPYSTLKKEYTRGKIEYNINNIYYMNRDEVKFITLESYNKISKTNFKSIKELIFNPPNFQTEVGIRREIMPNPYDLSLIVVVKQIPTQKIEIIYKSHIYTDVKEELVKV